MGIEIKIYGDSADQALAELQKFAQGTLLVITQAAPAAVEDHPEPGPPEAKPEPAKRGRKAKETAPNISAQPENRVDPAVAEQDAADEKAEVEESKPAAPPITHDDVRQAMGVYAKTFGMDAAMEDGSQIIGVAKISALPDDQDSLRKAVDAITAAIEGNPYKRERVTA